MKPTVFIICNEFKKAGGVEHQITLLSKMLKLRNWKPVVFTRLPLSSDNFYFREIKKNGIRFIKSTHYISIRLIEPVMAIIKPFLLILLPAALVFNRFSLKRSWSNIIYNIKEFLKRKFDFIKQRIGELLFLLRVSFFYFLLKPKLIHIFGAGGTHRVIEWASKRKLPIVYLESTESGEELSDNTEYLELIKVLDKVNFICSSSWAGKRGLQDYYKVKKDVHVIHIMIEEPLFEISQRNNDILTIGCINRLHKKKGIDDFIEAASELSKEYKSIKFLLAGDGPERERLYKKIEGLELRQIFILIPDFINIRDLARVMKDIDIFVMPSYTESISGAMIEAFAYKKAVVASAVGAIPLIINNNRRGLLFPPHDKTALKNCIKSLIEDVELRKKIAEEGYKFYYENCRPTLVIDKFIDIYREAIKIRNCIR